MKKLLVVLALVCLTGCSTLGGIFSGKPDPLPALNRDHIARLVAKDPDPADALANAQATAVAEEIVSSYGQTPDFPGLVMRAGGAAAGSGVPWLAEVGAIIGTLGAIFTTVKTLNRRAKGSPKPGPLAVATSGKVVAAGTSGTAPTA